MIKMDALSLRKAIKKRKPDFKRQDAHKKKRLSRTGYRKPRGLHSKVRLNKRGYVKKANHGYGSPAEAKNLHPSGLFPFVVENVSMLERIDPSKEGIIISSTVGMKKKIEIVNKAEELKIKILNVKDSKSFVETSNEILKDRKEKRTEVKKKQKKKEQKKQDNKKKSEEKESSDDDSSVKESKDEKKELENKEKNKVLTKKD